MTAQLTSYTKQGSFENLYFEEWRCIRNSTYPSLTIPGHPWPGAGEDEVEENGSGIEADPDAIWLENAGFGHLVNKLQRGNEIDEGGDIINCVLPRKHEVQVRKRMNTLRSTLRRQRDGEKKNSASKTDIRNVFNSPRLTSPTKSSGGVVTTAIRPLPGNRLNGSPRLSPSPHTSPTSSPRASPTPSRHLIQSPSHTTAHTSCLSLTTSSSRHTSAGNSIGRQPNSSSNLVRGSESLSERERDRYRGIKGRQKPAHHQSSDSGIVSRDSSSSNEFLNDGHSGSPEPVIAVDSRPSPPCDLSVSEMSPTGSVGSPTPEDIKLEFRTQQLGASNETTELPNFMVMPDALGITYIHDLSPPDMEKVRSVALVELTITFEDHNLPLRPRRANKLKNISENAVFGVPLTSLLQTDQQRVPGTQIPLIVEDMISYLETRCIHEEGLLRVPGNSARLQTTKQDIDSKFNQGDFSFDGMKATDVCSLLKMFIRELPVPLLTREYLPAFASIAEIGDLKEQVRTLNLLVLLLPSEHQTVLKRLLVFLERIIQNSATNKMDLTNVSMVIAPNLFMALPTRQNMDDVCMASKTSQVVRLLIKYHQLLWTVPGEMLRQIRYLNEIEMKKLNTRSVQKALKQMQQNQLSKGISQTALIDTSRPQIVKVQAPLYTRVCMAVDVTQGMTAGDIVNKLQKRSRLNKDLIKRRVSGLNFTESYFQGSTSSPVPEDGKMLDSDDDADVILGEQFVFEVGGNIGERCLANDTDMCSLYKANPNAQWVIKPRDWPNNL